MDVWLTINDEGACTGVQKIALYGMEEMLEMTRHFWGRLRYIY